MRVVAALSGGVDSAVAAARLVEVAEVRLGAAPEGLEVEGCAHDLGGGSKRCAGARAAKPAAN